MFSFDNLRSGTYIVEVIPPPTYEIVKEEDQNIYFPGQTLTPGLRAPIPGLENPSTVWPCVGAMHHIPEFETMFPEQQVPTINFPYDNTMMTPLCDRKQVTLTDGLNAVGAFPLFTQVPRAGRFVGLVTNDLVFEFNPTNVRKGDKLGPSWMPISFKDWQGNEVARVYTDQWGQYETMVPSTFTFAAPDPSGIQPEIITVALNDPGPIPLLDNVTGLPVIDPSTGQTKMVTDPFFDPGYVQFASKWDVWPGKTTIIDTPILPIAAFTQAHGKLDCELPDGTPVIAQVNGPGGGPYVPRAGTLLRISALTGVSVGSVPRDFGFGTVPGTVTLGDVTLEPVHWTNEIIVARIPSGATTGQLMVTRGDNGHPTVMGITVHVGGGVTRVGGGQTIQSVIDTANPGDLILVPPGIYKENLILWKPLRLQGYGPWATAINAGFFDPVAQAAWQAKITDLTLTNPRVLVVPGERADFFLEQGAGILVLSDNVLFRTNPSLIDGFLFTGAVQGSGIDVNGYVQNLVVSNNRIQSNQGFFGGAIRLGTPSIVLTDAEGNPVAGATTFNSNENSGIRIHHNHVDQNGATSGGGGIGIFNGADGLQIAQNFLCGNFSADIGGGILHLGLSDNVVIDNNVILLNESFTEGGGILLTGEAVPAGAPATALNVGTGNVTISRNLIQGNHAGSSGGGILTRFVNGQDVAANPADNTMWYRVDILNNLIVNNVGSHLAGGIAVADAVNINILHNTIAHNDSTATGSDAFGGPCNPQFQFNCGPEGPIEANAGGGSSASAAQAAGVVSQPHYANLQAVSGQTFSNPVLYNNVIWHNRAFSWDPTLNNNFGSLIPPADNAVYWNLSVFGAAPGMVLNPKVLRARQQHGPGQHRGGRQHERPPRPEARFALFQRLRGDIGGGVDGELRTGQLFSPGAYRGLPPPEDLPGDRPGRRSRHDTDACGVAQRLAAELRLRRSIAPVRRDDGSRQPVGVRHRRGGISSVMECRRRGVLPGGGRETGKGVRQMRRFRLGTMFLAAAMFLSGAAASALARGYCPGTVLDNATGQTDIPGVYCYHLGAGDGFTQMADGSPMYIFGFQDVQAKEIPGIPSCRTRRWAPSFPPPRCGSRRGTPISST